jgi:hypothetical protein
MELQAVGQLVLPPLMNDLATGPNDLKLPQRNALLYLLCRVMATEGGQVGRERERERMKPEREKKTSRRG